MNLKLDMFITGVGGRRTGVTATKSVDNLVETSITCQKAVAGTLTTRTSNTAGVVTVASHQLTAGDKVDVYFSAGRRITMNVDSTTSTTVTLSGGDGPNNLPVQGTAVTLGKQSIEAFVIDGSQVVALEVAAAAHGNFSFYDSVPAVQTNNEFGKTDSGGYAWWDTLNSSNPMTGFVSATVHLSTADTAKDQPTRVTAYRN